MSKTTVEVRAVGKVNILLPTHRIVTCTTELVATAEAYYEKYEPEFGYDHWLEVDEESIRMQCYCRDEEDVDLSDYFTWEQLHKMMTLQKEYCDYDWEVEGPDEY